MKTSTEAILARKPNRFSHLVNHYRHAIESRNDICRPRMWQHNIGLLK